MKYGILKSATNTGLDSEILIGFVAPLSIYSNQPEYIQDSLNLSRPCSSQNVQRWEIEANLEPANGSSDFLTHSVDNGRVTRFFARMPQVANLKTTTGIVTCGSPVDMVVDIPKNSATIGISIPNLVKGEFVQFESDSKVYLVIDGGANGVGVRLAPRPRKVIPAGTRLLVGGRVTLHCSYDADTRIGISFVDGVLSNPGSVKFVERI